LRRRLRLPVDVMTAIKAHQADQFLRTLAVKQLAILVFGNDAGLVSERARAAAMRLAGGGPQPAGEIVRIEDADLETDPDRLLVELQTVPMFGGPKVVHTRASRRVTAQVLKPLVEQDALAAALVVEAGNLRPDEALRAIFEKSRSAFAIACYADEAQDLDSLARSVMEAAGVGITPEAQQLLISRLGADRALTRGELDKLVLYARGKTHIDIDDVEAIVGDASELAIEKVVLATAAGQPGKAIADYDRLVAAGESPQSVIYALQRYFQRLHRLRTAVEAGRQLDDVLRQIRPPLNFRTRPQLEMHLRSWTAAKLLVAMAAIADAAKAARLSAALESAITERLILDLTEFAGVKKPPRPT
jgi:DNA polymerase-3 subunit delta